MSSDVVASADSPPQPPAAGPRSLPGWAPAVALGAILSTACVLYGWSLNSLGWGNTYYSAAVKSMGGGFTNFMFGSYDPAGVVTVDKPPAGLWPQVISSKVFGLHGWSLLLPQVVEGVLAVLVLHRTVRRWAGEVAGLVAALVLTLTPVTVAITRSNNLDAPLLLLLVGAAYALTRAVREPAARAATWWLCGAAFLIGCGFVTKMLAAWMVLPAFTAAWLVGAGGPWIARIWRLAAAGAVLAVSSLWWVAMVAVWPGDKPYIGGSEDGSAWDLVVGYNGLGRVFGQGPGPGGPGPGGAPPGGSGAPRGPGAPFGGGTGPLRMFGDAVGGQISWLLPVCAVAVVTAVAVAVLRRRGRLPEATALPVSGWVLWSLWLVVCAGVFSMQEGIFHEYYTTQLAPAIGALCGGLAAVLVRAQRAGERWPAPVAAVTVAVTAAWAVVVIRRAPEWHGWLVWPVAVTGTAAVVLLCAAFWSPGRSGRRGGSSPHRATARLLPIALAVAAAAVLVAPGAWAAFVPADGPTSMSAVIPAAGPMRMPSSGRDGRTRPGQDGPRGLPSGPATPGAVPEGMSRGGPVPPGPFPPGGGPGDAAALTADQRKILDYARRNSGSARITLAVEGGAMAASAFILHSDSHVIGMGGFTSADDAPSVRRLERWTHSGELRFVLASATPGGGGPFPSRDSAAARRTAWVTGHCRAVAPSVYGGSGTPTGGGPGGPGGAAGRGGAATLYDCAAR
ncbi:ArnT family glycosyltransferase [Actinomadura litoris]|uniref:Phospholipid carrier-dependent glycosyltransferase n=1 Tax=Actinomadura litoris TaxID=2678616 RepID=A0A7K1L3B0_9ACTN|nr:glycosyltransferase family 39 protein [Actinomadura litoris]MUN38914.1 phospholipid carrier-dependent glycosyltransferase [Actinomadura litoris]